MPKTLKFLFLSLYCGGLISCLPYSDAENLNVDRSNVEIAIPLFETSMSIPDVVEASGSSDDLTILPDGSMKLIYKGNVLERRSAEIFPPIPGFIDIPILDTVFSFPLPLTAGDVLKEAIIGNSNIQFNFSDPNQEKISIQVSMPEMVKDGIVFSMVFNMENGQLTTPTISLEDFILTPSMNNILVNYTAVTENGDRIKLDQVTMGFDFFVTKYIEGRFNPRTFDIRGDVITIGLLENWKSGNIGFNDPSLILKVENSFGLPTISQTNKLDIITTDGEVLKLSSPQLDAGLRFDFPSLEEVGEVKTTEVTFNATNSNIKDLFSEKASKIEYDIDALINTENPENPGFLTDNGFFKISALVELPLVLSLDELTLTASTDLDLKDLEDVNSAILKLNAINEFPISMNLQVYFINAGEIQDSLFDSGPILLDAATTNGNISNPSELNLEIDLDAGKISNLLVSETIEVEGKFNTIQSLIPVSLKENRQLFINAGLRIKLQ